MHQMALALLHDDDLARDIVHDVFASLLDSTPSQEVSLSYLMKAVRNRSLNYIRNCEIHKRIENRYFVENEEYETENWPDEETLARIYEVINNNISGQAGKVIKLRFADGLPFTQIAKEMGISETAVYRHLRLAIIKIRNKIID